MAEYYLNTEKLRESVYFLKCGDKVYLSGTVYTARDAAHSRIIALMKDKKDLPFKIKDAVIYYAGPTPTKPDGRIGSFGPTTSARMDIFSPALLDAGLCAMIGKGNRNQDVLDSIKKNSAVYFCAEGGMGALISKCIISCDEIAFKDLGPESIKKLFVKNLPLIVAADSQGNTIFNMNR